MNKELEALKRLLPHLPEGDLLEDEVRTLTLALKRKEKLENVWEIIKNKCQKRTYNLEMIIYCYREDTTETEFNLLKEMLEEK